MDLLWICVFFMKFLLIFYVSCTYRIDEIYVLNQLVERVFACKSCLGEILNLASANVDSNITIISERLTIATKACSLSLSHTLLIYIFS